MKNERTIDVPKRGRKFFSKFRNNDSEILDNVFNNNKTHDDLNEGDDGRSSKKVESNLNYLGLKELRLRSLDKREDDDVMLKNSSSMIFKDQHPLNFSSRSSVGWRRTEGGNNEGINLTARSKIRSLDGVVQIKMHNTSIIEGEGTRLIYSVHLGGKPVPAETAARDMALLSSQEVALELGVPVIIRSEREYKKDNKGKKSMIKSTFKKL